jgi:hypothetical protein
MGRSIVGAVTDLLGPVIVTDHPVASCIGPAHMADPPAEKHFRVVTSLGKPPTILN